MPNLLFLVSTLISVLYLLENPLNQHAFDNALIKIHEALHGRVDTWMIIGTGSLFLSGYPVKPNDIDILVSEATAAIAEELLKSYQIPFVNQPDSKFRSRFSKYMIDGVPVEVMGGLEVNGVAGWQPLNDVIKNPVEIKYLGRVFTIPGADDQKNIYKLFDREKDAAIITLLGDEKSL